MTEIEVFILADRTLEQVVHQIKPEQWDVAVPDGMSVRQPGLSLRQIINYHAYDDAWVPDTLSGKTMAEVGDKYDGDLLGDDPAASFSEIAGLAVAAAGEADLDRTVHLSYGDFPAREYLKHITSFRGFRAYDIARFIGVDPTLPAQLVQGMWDEIAPEVEAWRAMGVYGPAVPVAQDADLQSRLLGLVGRDPRA
jgi:uncharacterized protein (TIGR03086 family)